MHFLFPSHPLLPKQPDPYFVEQIEALKTIGYESSFISIESLEIGKCKIIPPLPKGETIVYRGWMITGDRYSHLYDAIANDGSSMFIDPKTYLRCHYLPNWYPLISEFTPQTFIYPTDVDLQSELDRLEGKTYFIKDYVKSLKTAQGSLLKSRDDVPQLIADMIKFRGEIEGGFCVREVEEFIPDSETRYFVLRGIAYGNSPEEKIPKIVNQIGDRINSPFFSIDVVKHTDGRDRIVEIGDGQVSDLVGWTPQRFAIIWQLAES